MSVHPFIVGAYASLPEGRERQETYYRMLADLEWVSGIEIPYPGDLAENWQWLLERLPQHWEASTITAIPGTMVTIGKNPRFGLASADPEGRRAALEFTERIREVVLRMADKRGQRVVSRVQLHSGPTGEAHADAYLDSLSELSEREWAGACIVTEHCDAPREGRKPEKGFLEIDDEISIARQAGTGIHINWGRSCLEERDPSAPLRHIEAAAEAGVLAGVLFSGAGPEATQYGYEWIDGHLPATPDEPTSLMTLERIGEAARAARDGGAAYLGAKICVPARASLEERIAMIARIRDAAR